MGLQRIAYLLPAPGIPVQGPSGASAHVRGQVQALGHEYDVHLLASRISDHRGIFGDTLPVHHVSGVPGWPSWLDRYRDLQEVWTGRRLARAVVEQAHQGWTPDLILERHSLFSDAGWRAHDRLRVPWVLEVNAPLAEERQRFERLRRPGWAQAWERDVLRAAPTIVAVSHWLVNWLEQEVGCANVHHIPNGVVAARGDRAAGRALLGLNATERVLGFLGTPKPWHGTEHLDRIARAVGARLVIIGDAGSDFPDAICPGFLAGQALADAIAAMDVGLSPYTADAPPWLCPLKILAYRAQGTPVVSTDVGDARDLVGAGGSVIPTGDEDGLISASRLWLTTRCPIYERTWSIVGDEVLSAVGLLGPGAPR